MKDTDTKLLEEAYETVQEGIWDQMKARRAASKEKPGIGTRIGQNIKGAVRGMRGDVEGVQQVQQQKAQAQSSQLWAKTASIMQSHIKRLESVMAGMNADLKKLGLDADKKTGNMQSINPEAAGALRALNGAVKNLKSRLLSTGQVGKTLTQNQEQPEA